MRKVLYIMVLLLAVFITSCDRFEHTFKPETTVDVTEVIFTPLQTAFESATSADVSALMALYDDDYLHNSQQKTDREAWFQDLLGTYSNLTFDINLIASQDIGVSDTLSMVTWRLTISDNTKQVVADSTFYGEEIIKRGDSWKLYGNRVTCCPPITYKQRVFVETFTYITCPNCPVVEALLHQLQIDNPYNFTYLEYHLNDPLDTGNLDVYGYYNYPEMPSVVFQGSNVIIGNNTDNEQIFNQLTTQIADTDAKIVLTNLDYVLSGQTLSGSIHLDILDNNVEPSLLKLKYAILDKESADYTNSAGAPCRNVVLAKGTKSLQGADLAQAVNFNLPYAGTLPIDSYLVIWVQETPDPFNSNAAIYNGLESPITVNKHK
jgi:hypothetical protein